MLQTLVSGEYVQTARYSTKKPQKLAIKHNVDVDISIASYAGKTGLMLIKFAAYKLILL